MFTVKVKANTDDFWLGDELSATISDPVASGKMRISYKRLSWVEILTKTFTLQGNPMEMEKAGT